MSQDNKALIGALILANVLGSVIFWSFAALSGFASSAAPSKPLSDRHAVGE